MPQSQLSTLATTLDESSTLVSEKNHGRAKKNGAG